MVFYYKIIKTINFTFKTDIKNKEVKLTLKVIIILHNIII